MSHYTVTVRLTKARLDAHQGEVEDALKEILAPFDENTDNPAFLELVKGEDGEEDYQRNPNAKWDWYTIGGRWRGFWPVKDGVGIHTGEAGAFGNKSAGGSDIVRVSDIDMDTVTDRWVKDCDKFRREYREFLSGKKFPHFEGPRSTMLDMGLLRVEEDSSKEIGPDEIDLGKWGTDDDRKEWRDIARVVDDKGLDAYLEILNPIRTYAFLDDAGWHAPGNMGWFGCSSDNPTSLLAYANDFRKNVLEAAGPEDLLVLVDCHI